MRRHRKPTAILTGDTHLREDVPVCRTDDFLEERDNKLRWLRGVQEDYDGIPVLNSGDVFHHWKPSPALLQVALDLLPDNMIAIPGNHDLPAHSLESYHKCGLGVLEKSGKVLVLTEGCFLDLDNRFRFDHAIYPFPWGIAPKPYVNKDPFADGPDGLRNIAIAHIFTYVGRSPWPGCTAPGANTLLKQMSGYDLVLTGDNHKPFVVEDGGRLLVNPGSMMRTTSDQADFQPRLYLWYAEDNTVEPLYFPIKSGVVSRTHIDKVEERDERMSAFVERLDGEFEVGLSFENNLKEFFGSNRVRSGVQNLVWSAVKGE